MRSGGVKELNFFNRRAFAPKSAYHHDGLQQQAERMLRSCAGNPDKLNAKWVRLLSHLYDARVDGDWYEEIFRVYPNPHRLAGDFTPEYAMLPQGGVAEIRNFAPAIRLIMMLRDPVERVLSHIGMLVDQVPAARPFADELAREASVVGRSRYDLILPRWQSEFGPEQLKVVCQEALTADPAATAGDIGLFLGVDPQLFDAGAVARKIFKNKQQPLFSPETVDWLEAELAEARRLYRETSSASRC